MKTITIVLLHVAYVSCVALSVNLLYFHLTVSVLLLTFRVTQSECMFILHVDWLCSESGWTHFSHNVHSYESLFLPLLIHILSCKFLCILCYSAIVVFMLILVLCSFFTWVGYTIAFCLCNLFWLLMYQIVAFSALTLLVGWQEGHRPVKTERWGAGMVIFLEQGANDLHTVQLMPLPPHHLLLH